MKSKKFAVYAKKNFVQMKKIKNIKIRKKSEVIVILQENLEELLIVVVI